MNRQKFLELIDKQLKDRVLGTPMKGALIGLKTQLYDTTKSTITRYQVTRNGRFVCEVRVDAEGRITQVSFDTAVPLNMAMDVATAMSDPAIEGFFSTPT